MLTNGATMSKKTSLDKFLHEIDKNFISIKDAQSQFALFKNVFDQIHETIKEVDSYYQRYSSKIQFAGSFYDGVKVGQLDEFDMDIIIRLPINYDDIIIEPHSPAFIKLKIDAFDTLDKQPSWESHNKVTRDWRDDRKYLLQSQFRNYMESIVTKAIIKLQRKVDFNGATYHLALKKSGPAITVNVRNAETKKSVDVDLVPVIQFQLKHWPAGYRKRVNEGDQNKNMWYVVPKPNKAIEDLTVQNRCWRLAFHDQEREIIKSCDKLKPTLRFMKKLRDSMGMKSIASYYIKTLFLWKVEEPNDDKTYWNGKQSVIFKDMVQSFHDALEAKEIPYFWNKDYNLIGAVKDDVLIQYASKLKMLLQHFEENSIIDIVKALLTQKEYAIFKNVEIFKAHLEELKVPVPTPVKKSSSTISLIAEKMEPKSPRMDSVPADVSNTLLNSILTGNNRIESLVERVLEQVASLQGKVMNLEMQVKSCNQKMQNFEKLLKQSEREQAPNEVRPLACNQCFIHDILVPIPSVHSLSSPASQDLDDLLN